MNGGQSPASAGAAPRFRTAREVPAGAPIHQSLVNPVLIMGMERKPAISLLTTVAALFLGPGIHLYTFAWATALLVIGTYALGKLAQIDPQMDDVLVRFASYDRVYDPEAPADWRNPWWRIWNTTSALAGALRPAVPTPKEI
jgi:type IV secretory pathway TrbD component